MSSWLVRALFHLCTVLVGLGASHLVSPRAEGTLAMSLGAAICTQDRESMNVFMSECGPRKVPACSRCSQVLGQDREAAAGGAEGSLPGSPLSWPCPEARHCSLSICCDHFM